MNYYNENEPFAANWLRALIAEKLIPAGHVDDRSIMEVQPNDLEGFTQCHFFAGLGGWSKALELAGWDSTRPVWTGSVPCQPLSCAGKRGGEKDKRHLWPEFYRLISECHPSVVCGEQTASGDGPEWLDGISLDLEELGYAVAAADLPSAGVGSPNIRQRLWWVAHMHPNGRDQKWQCFASPRNDGPDGNSSNDGRERERTATLRGFWNNYQLIQCRDGKQRRIPAESALFPLAPGLPGRVGLLRGAGNAINPYVAAEFIKAFMEAT